MLFIFVGAFDWGFYAHALIATQNAARIAATATSANSSTAADSALACNAALDVLRKLPNIGSGVTTCGSNPQVTATSVAGPDGGPATRVTVQYRSIGLIPIPGMLAGQLVVRRQVEMRLRG
jgi:hypothetical protein